MSSYGYAKETIRIVELHMQKHDLTHPSSRRHGSNTPFNNSLYRPELDYTEFCSDELSSLYLNLIGMLRCMCEIGTLDILHETVLLSQYMGTPRLGHLHKALNLYKYLKKKDKRSWLVFDPMSYGVKWVSFGDEYHPMERAKHVYDVGEPEKSHNMPEARGKEVNINIFVNVDHGGNRVTIRSHTGIIIFLNMVPINFYSKKAVNH